MKNLVYPLLFLFLIFQPQISFAQKVAKVGEVVERQQLVFYHESPGISLLDHPELLTLRITGTEALVYMAANISLPVFTGKVEGKNFALKIDPRGEIRIVRFSDKERGKVLKAINDFDPSLEWETFRFDSGTSCLRFGRFLAEHQKVVSNTAPVVIRVTKTLKESRRDEKVFDVHGYSEPEKMRLTFQYTMPKNDSARDHWGWDDRKALVFEIGDEIPESNSDVVENLPLRKTVMAGTGRKRALYFDVNPWRNNGGSVLVHKTDFDHWQDAAKMAAALGGAGFSIGGYWFDLRDKAASDRFVAYLKANNESVTEKNPVILTVDNNHFYRVVKLEHYQPVPKPKKKKSKD